MASDIHSAPTLEAMIRAGAAALEGAETPRLDARVLARHALGCDDAALIARAADPVPDRVKDAFENYIRRRDGGEPVAYVTGVKEFWGLEFAVNAQVLIPRNDSECLIDAIITRCDRKSALRMLDLGTGSGCLLCALLHEFPNASGLGVDISPAAVGIAGRNAAATGVGERAEWRVSDWFENVDGQFDVIIANAPYIPEGDRNRLPVDVSAYEPAPALFSGADGLDAYRKIFKGAPAHLADEAIMVVEYGDARQGSALRRVIAEALPRARASVIRDLAARERGAVLEVPAGNRD